MQELRSFVGHTDVTTCVAVLPDEVHVISGSADKTLRLWDIETARCVGRFEGHTEQVNSVAVSPDGRYAVSGSAEHDGSRMAAADW